MASPPPPDPSKERGLFYSFKDRLRRAKDSTKSPDLSARGPGLLSPSSSGFRLFSRSRSTTPDTRLLSASDEGPAGSSPKPPAIDNKHKRQGNAEWGRLKKSLRALEKGTKLIPSLSLALNALIECLDVVQIVSSKYAEYKQLANELATIAAMLNQYTGELDSEMGNTSLANIVQSIEDQIAGIKQQQERSNLGHLIDATNIQEDIINRYRLIEGLFRQIQCQVTLRIGSGVQEQLETSLLRGMLPVDDARYNSSYSTTVRRQGCTPQTRNKIHQDLRDWVVDPDSAKIYWMSGMAGTGKTTIAYSLCEWLERTNRLGASFFCSRISSTCRSLDRIVPTLAYQFARYSPAFRSTLCTSLMENRDAGTLNVAQQFEHLIRQPIFKAKAAIPGSVVLVIDALDECDDSYSVHLLLGVLLKFAERLPLKFFVASRPEYVIMDQMMSSAATARSIMHLHDIEQSIVEEDIKKYLADALSSMSPPPSPRQIEILAKRAGKLFIYAATVVRYVHPKVIPVNSSARLEAMLEATRTIDVHTENKYKELDRLYATVLDAAFNEDLGIEETHYLRRVLWTVVCMKEPMTSAAIASLVGLTEPRVWTALQSLRSVVHIPENNGLISSLHASFPEYMLDESRSKGFCCNKSQSNETLTRRCFEIMKSELRFNICNLQSAYLMDSQVDDLETRVTQYISPTLSYACRYWGGHLLLAPDSEVEFMLDEFLANQLLFWMEVLNLKRSIGAGAPMLHQVQTYLRTKHTYDDIQKKVADARNFVTWYAANPCSSSTPHIYISALPFCAKSNWVYQHYWKRTQGLANVSISQQDDALLAVWSTTTPVCSLSISPGGDQIAAGVADGSIHIYDIHTGAMILNPFKGHRSYVNSVSFSPDGMLIVSGSDDTTVIVWGTHTGNITTGPLRKHTERVWSVAFSPDGKRIVSGSEDETVIVWDTYSGDVIIGPLEGHLDKVFSVAFSPDARLIASGSKDQTIRLWDASTGAAVNKPLEGHVGAVNGIAFLLDGSQLVSCSNDKTIRMWDIRTQSTIGKPIKGQRGRIETMSLSPDSTQIVSGGDDADPSVIIWDMRTGSMHVSSIHRHSKCVRSVLFSPDSTRIISCSEDQTIRIWDVRTKKGPVQNTTSQMSVGPLAFSPDRSHFVSSSPSGALVVSELHTGATISHAFEEKPDPKSIVSLALSPQGSYVAASVSDFSVRVWNVLTGAMITRPLRRHNNSVRCLSFSPDGTHLCSGSDDSTIIVWSIKAGPISSQSCHGHTGPVRSVTYSPDGTRIASGAADGTIRVWDSVTGVSESVHVLSGHKDLVAIQSIAFSHDGKYIVSGSSDGSVRKWDLGVFDEPVILERISRVYYAGVSPDSTQIIAASCDTIYILDAQTTNILSELSATRHERFCWVGFSPGGSEIISVSNLVKTGLEELPVDSPPKDANIIRIWRAGAQLDLEGSSSYNPYRSSEPDGRILSPQGFVIWVPPDLLQYLSLESKSRYFNSFVMSADGIIDIGHNGLCIGDKWVECYIHEG